MYICKLEEHSSSFSTTVSHRKKASKEKKIFYICKTVTHHNVHPTGLSLILNQQKVILKDKIINTTIIPLLSTFIFILYHIKYIISGHISYHAMGVGAAEMNVPKIGPVGYVKIPVQLLFFFFFLILAPYRIIGILRHSLPSK